MAEYGRRVTAPDVITTGKEKLEQKTIDFEQLDSAGFRDKKWDVVFITYVHVLIFSLDRIRSDSKVQLRYHPEEGRE